MKKTPLMKSVSGIRGIVGDSINPELITKVASAFADYTGKGTVVIGRDTRPTGEAISLNLQSALALKGCRVIDIGIVPTPTVQLMVEELNAAGGIVVSASHNPIQWNAFKLIGPGGMFLNKREITGFFKSMDREPVFPSWEKTGSIEKNDSADSIHIKKVLEVVDLKKIKTKKFTVVLDSVNGAGSVITKQLLESLGCRVYPLYCTPDGMFPRGPEPRPENLTDLCSEVVKRKADIGIAQDPDADRLALVDEKGNCPGEEYTLALVVEHLLSIKKGRVVVNLSTTRAIDDIAERHGVKVKRTPVGEINVADEMHRNGARIGGEGNGGVIAPELHLGRDSLAGIGYVLEMMAQRKKSLSELMREMPAYFMIKDSVKLKHGMDPSQILKKLKQENSSEKISTADGLRIDFKKTSEFAGSWIHLRSSNTEPIFRIIAESNTDKLAKELVKRFKKKVLAG